MERGRRQESIRALSGINRLDFASYANHEGLEFKRSQGQKEPLWVLRGTNQGLHRIGSLLVECMDVRPGFSLTHHVVRGPGINGGNIGAGIECEPDEIFKIKHRGAPLKHAKVD